MANPGKLADLFDIVVWSTGGTPDSPQFHGEATYRDGLQFFADWERRHGRWEPYRFVVQRLGGALSASQVRQLPMGELLWRMRQRIDSEAREALEDHERPGVRRDVVEKFLIRGPQRGQALTDDDLAVVADAYRRAWSSGLPVTEAVQNACHLSKSGATKRIMAARKAGLLDGVGLRQ